MRFPNVRSVALVGLLVLAGCPMPLTATGAKVRVIVGDPANDCVEVGSVDGVNLSKGDNGYEWAENDIRDQAGRKGATHVRIDRKSEDDAGTKLMGTAYKCPNAPPPAISD